MLIELKLKKERFIYLEEAILDLFEGKNNKSLTMVIFEKIRNDILNNHYCVGEKIVEMKLAESLGVSRTPVREALKQLELEGLITNIPNRGVVVQGLSEQDILDIHAIRSNIEGIAVKWAVERMNDELVKELTEIYDLMEFYAFKKDFEKMLEMSSKFHEMIYTATKSRYLEQVLRDYQLFIQCFRINSLKSSGRAVEVLKEYKEILEGFAERDVERTYRAMTYHMQHIRQ